MNNADKEYLRLCEDILHNGTPKEDRTGTGTLSVFGRQLRFDLSEGFPLLTTKRVPFRLIAEELLFFVAGKTNLKELLDKNVDIWTRDGYAMFLRDMDLAGVVEEERLTLDEFRAEVLEESYGFDLGPIYGAQWRSWNAHGEGHIDQLYQAIYDITHNPDSRRMIVSAWNPAELEEMALPPCHIMYQFYVADGKLSLQMYQRSADVFLGLPFNIASYALLLKMVAQVTGLDVGELVITLGDAHIYTNHISQVITQISREPKELPEVFLDTTIKNIDDFTGDHIAIQGYEPHGALKGAQSY